MTDGALDLIKLAPGDYWPAKSRPETGKLHLCLMCRCGSFVPFVTMDRRKLNKVFMKCEGALSFTCPSCDEHQTRSFPEFIQVVYSEQAVFNDD